MSDNPDKLLEFFDNITPADTPIEPLPPKDMILLALETYTDLEVHASIIRQEFEDAKFKLIPEEIRHQLVELDRQQQEKIEKTQTSLAKLKAEIVKATEDLGESVNTPKGIRSAIYTVRTEWDSKRLDGYAVAHPDILQLQSKKVVITIR